MLAFKWIEGMFFFAAVVSSASVPLLVESANTMLASVLRMAAMEIQTDGADQVRRGS